MMSMEEMSSPSPNSDAQDNIDANGQEAPNPSSNQTGAPSRLSQLCRKCSCCCSGTDSQSISLNKIEPVIFQPLNDIYLQLKPHRRLRVIHINGQQGAIPTHSPYYLISGWVNNSWIFVYIQVNQRKTPSVLTIFFPIFLVHKIVVFFVFLKRNEKISWNFVYIQTTPFILTIFF